MLALVGGHAALTGGLGISSSLCALQNACSARWWAIFDAGTLLFGWLGCEILCSALLSGEFDVLRRCARAVRSSLYFYLSLLAGLACLLLWLQLPRIGLATMSALTNGAGLVLVSLLLGQGIVLLPLRLWARAAPDDELRSLAYAFATMDGEHRTRSRSLSDCLQHLNASVREAPMPTAASDQAKREALLELASHVTQRATISANTAASLSSRLRGAWPALAIAPSEAGLIRQHRRLKLAFAAERAAWHRRQHILRQALALRRALSAQEEGFGGSAVPARRGLWLGALREVSFRAAALLLVLLGGLHLWGAAMCGVALDLSNPASCHLGIPLLRHLLLFHVCASTAFALSTSNLYVRVPLWWPEPDGRAILRISAWFLRLLWPLIRHVHLTSGAWGTALRRTADEVCLGLPRWKESCHRRPCSSQPLTPTAPTPVTPRVAGGAQLPRGMFVAYHGCCPGHRPRLLAALEHDSLDASRSAHFQASQHELTSPPRRCWRDALGHHGRRRAVNHCQGSCS